MLSNHQYNRAQLGFETNELFMQTIEANIRDWLGDKVNWRRANLIPAYRDSQKELRIVSILLAGMSIVPPLAETILRRCDEKMPKRARLHTFTEIEFQSSDEGQNDRPDGLIVLELGRTRRWSALVEAKIENKPIDEQQVARYADLAKKFGVDAVITLSNQLAPLATHLPYEVPRRKISFKNIDFYHLSWISIVTDLSVILKETENLDLEQAIVLEEMACYFEHANSGVRRLDQVNKEWKDLVNGLFNDQPYTLDSIEIRNSVAFWQQKERDISLLLTQAIGMRVGIALSRKFRNDPETRLREACKSLLKARELQFIFDIPNASSHLTVAANFQKRTIACTMGINAPDRPQFRSRVTWLLRQLSDITDSEAEHILIRALWSGRLNDTQSSLVDVRSDLGCLNHDRSGVLPVAFEISKTRDLGARFGSTKKFLQEIENLIPEFYEQIGQKLKRWQPSPPPIKKSERIGSITHIDSDSRSTEDGRSSAEDQETVESSPFYSVEFGVNDDQ